MLEELQAAQRADQWPTEGPAVMSHNGYSVIIHYTHTRVYPPSNSIGEVQDPVSGSRAGVTVLDVFFPPDNRMLML